MLTAVLAHPMRNLVRWGLWNAWRARVETVVSCQDVRIFRAAYAEYARHFSHVVYFPLQAAFPLAGTRAVVCDGVGGLEMVSQRCMRFVRCEKWLLDKSLAALAFVCLAPFFVLVPILIKLTSRGPVFYRQNRLGKDGRPIRVWKFRSMDAEADRRLQSLLENDPAKKAEWERNFKLADDPRVTPLGGETAVPPIADLCYNDSRRRFRRFEEAGRPGGRSLRRTGPVGWCKWFQGHRQAAHGKESVDRGVSR